MRGHDPISDTSLLLGSVFVAVAVVGIGILGGQQGPEQIATISPTAMTAATTPAATTKQECLPKSENNQASVKTTCFDGCHYIVTAGSFPAKATVTSTTKYSDGSKNLGTVQFMMSTTEKTIPCKAGASGQPATLGDSGGSVGYDTLRGAVGSGDNSLNVVQPAAAPANTATLPAQYTMNNLPTAPGTYALSGGAPNELVSYDPSALNGKGAHYFWSQDNINGAMAANGPPSVGQTVSGTVSPSGGFEGFTTAQYQQAQYLGQGNGFNGDTAGEIQAAQKAGQTVSGTAPNPAGVGDVKVEDIKILRPGEAVPGAGYPQNVPQGITGLQAEVPSLQAISGTWIDTPLKVSGGPVQYTCSSASWFTYLTNTSCLFGGAGATHD